MLGYFQTSELRIEVAASEQTLRDCLQQPAKFQQWLLPQRFAPGLPDRFTVGLTFTNWVGPISIQHYVDSLDESSLRLILSQGIDGFHEWQWGEGWIQSRLEGVSVLPLVLGQTLALARLRQFWISANT